MNKQKKLIEILYGDNFEFPDGYDCAAQDKFDMAIWCYSDNNIILKQGVIRWDIINHHTRMKRYCKHIQLASDWDSSIVTRQQYKDYCEKQNKEKNMKPKTIIKVEDEVFEEIMNGNRCFHVEYNNIEFQKGDIIGLCARFKTGMLSIVITHTSTSGVKEGFIAFGFKLVQCDCS